jgi:hypothetical protein
MSRTHVLVVAAVALVATFAVWRVCSGGRTAPSDPPSPTNTVATGTTAPGPASTKTQEEMIAAAREAWNKDAHGLLKSFESRIYDPRRESLLEHAEGEIDALLDGKTAKYRFVYDTANKATDPVTIEKIEEASGVDAERLGRVRQWAIVACCGPYAFVAFYVPPIPLLLVPASDPKSKNLIVWAQPFHGPLNVSYSFDERQVVVSRGEWTDEKNKVVTNFDWVSWHGRLLLGRSAIFQGAVTEFDYADRDGVHLLEKVRVGAGADTGSAVFTYKSIRRRTR